MAPLKKVVSGSVEWAHLEEAGDCEVNKFIASLDSPTEGENCGDTVSYRNTTLSQMQDTSLIGAFLSTVRS